MVMVGGGTVGGIGSARATWGKGLTDDEAFQMLDTAVGMGINVVDTANSYAGGHSEAVIGEWLRERSADVLVATKVGNLVEPDQVDICLTNDHILRQFAASLQRLGLDKVDMYMSHAPDTSTPIAETLEAFAALIEMGQVGAIGACNISAPQLTEALVEADRLGLPRYEWVQNEYSVLARDDEDTVIPLCRDHGLGYTPHSVLSGGVLSGNSCPGRSS